MIDSLRPEQRAHRRRWALVACVCSLASLARADVVRDGSLGADEPLGGDDTTFIIEEQHGARSGSNLFHSFLEFDLDAGESAIFRGADSIENVIGRITGGPSEIGGLIRSEIPGANLFLINPAGIAFTGSAILDVDGAFHATTADFLEFGFDSSQRFFADPGKASALAPVDVSAFGFLSAAPAPIEVRGSAPLNLSGSAFSLVGGDLTLEWVDLQTRGEDISLTSVGAAGRVPFAQPGDPASARGMRPLGGSIRISNSTLGTANGGLFRRDGTIDTTPVVQSGDIRILGGDLTIEGSSLLTDGERAGRIDLALDGTLDVSNTFIDASGGTSGSISIRAGDVSLRDFGLFVEGDLISPARSGIDILARGDVSIGTLGGFASISTSASLGPIGPGIRIRAARSLSILDTPIVSISRGSTRAGSIQLAAGASLDIAGLPTRIGGPGFEFLENDPTRELLGAGPGIELQAPKIELRAGSSVLSPAAAGGRAGDVRIRADELTLRDASLISTQALSTANSGDVAIQVGRLNVLSGSVIESASLGVGSAGRIAIAGSESVRIAGGFLDSTAAGVAGGGSIEIVAPVVSVEAGGSVETASFGMSPAGSIEILASDSLRLDRGFIGSDSATADGGTIHIGAGQRLLLSNDSLIATDVLGGDGDGGNIAVDSEVTVLRNSSIAAGADAGDGGRIDLRSQFLLVGADSEITAMSRLGRDGVVDIEAPEGDVVRSLLPLDARIRGSGDLLEPRCQMRPSDSRGSLIVRPARALPIPPDDLLIGFSILSPVTPDVAARPGTGEPASASGSADRRVAAALYRGRFAEATRDLESALSGSEDARSNAVRWLWLARVLMEQQELDPARRALDQSLELAEALSNPALQVEGLSGLAHIALTQGELELATERLGRAFAIAEDSRDETSLALAHLNRAGQRLQSGELERALEDYRASARLAAQVAQRDGANPRSQTPQKSGPEATHLAARAHAGAARTAWHLARPKLAEQMLADARQALLHATPSHDVLHTKIHMAETYARMADLQSADRDAHLLAAYELLLAVGSTAEQRADARAATYAFGNLARLYHSENRFDEALTLARRALSWADAVQDVEAGYLWHWQLGRTLREQGQSEAALKEFRLAVDILEGTRAGAPRIGNLESSFRDRIGAVYLDLVDALLASAGRDPNVDREKRLLEARATLDKLGVAELRDYFQDDCVEALRAREVPVDRASSTTAVVYPILLPDRTEILVSHAGRIRRYRPENTVPAAVVAEQAHVFGALLQRGYGSGYLPASQKLYDWLVRPYVGDLARAGVDTLVFVPTGVLRGIPLAALHDGEDFLVRNFALAASPGLSVLDPKPFDPDGANILLAGLSEPVRGLPPLTHVTDELEAIRAMYGGRELIDREFTAGRVSRSVRDNEYSVIHLASHASFSGGPRDSYIVTYDGAISITSFSELVRQTQFREKPVELLVLSACETARGNDRAVLGLAGFALRSGARSALGSLFRIDDAAALELITTFYRELRQPGRSRAEALRRAQVALLDAQPRFSHPSNWAPFLLLGSWL